MSQAEVVQAFDEHLVVAERCKKELLGQITVVADILRDIVRGGGKILLCGNGGSAADAQHLAAELIGRFKKERPSVAAIALTTDTSALTALGNDYAFDEIFSRQVSGIGNRGDALIGISTSGRSKNVVRAIEEAKVKGCTTIALAGNDGGYLASSVDYPIVVPSNDTARIQEMHILIGHILCEQIELSIIS